MSKPEHERLTNGTNYPNYSSNFNHSQHFGKTEDPDSSSQNFTENYDHITHNKHENIFSSPNDNYSNQYNQLDNEKRISFLEKIAEKLPFVRGRPITYKLRENINAGITVSLINLPLSISLSLASHGTPTQGVITAIYSGFIGAIFGGSHFNIMGPTGALSGILLQSSVTHGSEALPVLSIIAGLMCILVFLLGADKYATFLPSGVNIGFTFGVAIIIACNQIPSMFSLKNITQTTSFVTNLRNNLKMIPKNGNLISFAFFALFWLPLFFLSLKYKGKPWLLLLVIFGTLLGYLSTQGIFGLAIREALPTLLDKYGQLKLSLWEPKPIPASMLEDSHSLISSSASVAFVAVLETIISGKIADGTAHTTMNPRRETLAVGLSNLFSGLAGGLPSTAALARTALNLNSGAVSRVAGVINAISTTAIGLVVLPLFVYLPLPVVAAMLFQTAAGMIEVEGIKRLFRLDSFMFFLCLLVMVLCIIDDPTTGIVIGSVIGLLRFAQNVSSAFSRVFIMEASTEKDGITTLSMSRSSSFHNVTKLEDMKNINQQTQTKPYNPLSNRANADGYSSAGYNKDTTPLLQSNQNKAVEYSSNINNNQENERYNIKKNEKNTTSIKNKQQHELSREEIKEQSKGWINNQKNGRKQKNIRPNDDREFHISTTTQGSEIPQEDSNISVRDKCRQFYLSIWNYIKEEVQDCFAEPSPFVAESKKEKQQRIRAGRKEGGNKIPNYTSFQGEYPIASAPISHQSHDASQEDTQLQLQLHLQQGKVREEDSSKDVIVKATKGSEIPPTGDNVIEQEYFDNLSMVVYRLIGKLAYINILQHRSRFESLTSITHLVISFRYCFYIDVDGIEFLEEVVKNHEKNPGHYVYFCSVHPMLVMFCKSNIFRIKKEQGHLFSTHKAALAYIDYATEGVLNASQSEAEDSESDEGF